MRLIRSIHRFLTGEPDDRTRRVILARLGRAGGPVAGAKVADYARLWACGESDRAIHRNLRWLERAGLVRSWGMLPRPGEPVVRVYATTEQQRGQGEGEGGES